MKRNKAKKQELKASVTKSLNKAGKGGVASGDTEAVMLTPAELKAVQKLLGTEGNPHPVTGVRSFWGGDADGADADPSTGDDADVGADPSAGEGNTGDPGNSGSDAAGEAEAQNAANSAPATSSSSKNPFTASKAAPPPGKSKADAIGKGLAQAAVSLAMNPTPVGLASAAAQAAAAVSVAEDDFGANLSTDDVNNDVTGFDADIDAEASATTDGVGDVGGGIGGGGENDGYNPALSNATNNTANNNGNTGTGTGQTTTDTGSNTGSYTRTSQEDQDASKTDLVGFFDNYSNLINSLGGPQIKAYRSKNGGLVYGPASGLQSGVSPGIQRVGQKTFAAGGLVEGYAAGGAVQGNPLDAAVPPGVDPGQADTIDAKLSKGEFIVPAKVVQFLGADKINKMIQKAMEDMKEMEDQRQVDSKKIEQENIQAQQNAGAAPAPKQDPFAGLTQK